jgi:hypothetical protein
LTSVVQRVAGLLHASKNASKSGLVAGPRSSTSGPLAAADRRRPRRQVSMRLKYGRQCA